MARKTNATKCPSSRNKNFAFGPIIEIQARDVQVHLPIAIFIKLAMVYHHDHHQLWNIQGKILNKLIFTVYDFCICVFLKRPFHKDTCFPFFSCERKIVEHIAFLMDCFFF